MLRAAQAQSIHRILPPSHTSQKPETDASVLRGLCFGFSVLIGFFNSKLSQYANLD